MKAKLKYPGSDATRDYIRRVMSDGRWRTSSDIVTRAARDGMVLTVDTAGCVMGDLSRDGVLYSDNLGNIMMWKARRSYSEAAE